MLISAVCLMDTSSVLISVKLFSFASPLFIFWYFGLYHDIRNGIKYGVYAGSAINILGCALQYAGVHLSRPILDINRAQGFLVGRIQQEWLFPISFLFYVGMLLLLKNGKNDCWLFY